MGDEMMGLSTNHLTEVNNYSPTPAEVELLEIKMNPNNVGLNVTEICKLWGRSRTYYYEVMKNPNFKKLLTKTSVDLVYDGLNDALAALKKSAANPSPKANPDRRLLFELAGVSKVADGDKIMIINVRNEDD